MAVTRSSAAPFGAERDIRGELGKNSEDHARKEVSRVAGFFNGYSSILSKIKCCLLLDVDFGRNYLFRSGLKILQMQTDHRLIATPEMQLD